MDEGIFSTYRQGENRVTASILAVLRSLALPRIEFVLGALLRESEFQLVRFENQIVGSGESVPDAEIVASLRLLVETKTKPNSLNRKQLECHLTQLENRAGNRLLVLTPDQLEPAIIGEIGDDRLVWASFTDFNQAIELLLHEEKEVVSEREEFLLRELQKMLQADRLLGAAKEVVVVAARKAWPEYQKIHAYVCQANRPFQQVKYIAFYAEGQIQPIIPAILNVKDEVVFQKNETLEAPWREFVARMLKEGRREVGEMNKVFLLSAPDDTRNTIKLEHPITNDLPHAFVQGQRYVSLPDLRRVKMTSQLDENCE